MSESKIKDEEQYQHKQIAYEVERFRSMQAKLWNAALQFRLNAKQSAGRADAVVVIMPHYEEMIVLYEYEIL